MSGWLLLAALLVLAPISWLWPSRRERLRMKWRQEAAISGVRVRLGPLKIGRDTYPATAYQWLRDAVKQPLSHSRWVRQAQVEHGAPEAQVGWCCDQGDEGLFSAEEYQVLYRFFQDLPDDVLAVERGSATVTLWWREVGLPEAWAELDAQVRELMMALGDLKAPVGFGDKDECR